MIEIALKEITQNKNLEYKVMKETMREITGGKIDEIKISAFLTALRVKGETEEEITAAAEVMKEKCIKTELETDNIIDIVGTGGDNCGTFNISTASAFVAAAGGIPVAKHGNRAQTSKSGSTDVLEALGINADKTPGEEKEIFNKLNICFMFAQNHHPAMKYASSVRKSLPFRTLFNILGPLTNPAGAKSQLFGVFDGSLTNKLARVISNLGVKNVIVVHGKDGTDEATITDETIISEGRNGIIKDYIIKPEDFGIKRCSITDIQGADAETNAQIIRNIFSGKEQGAKKDIVVLNSALAFYTYNKVKSVNEGINLARAVLDNGLALDKLNKYIELTRSK